jgi:hypothetical protein
MFELHEIWRTSKQQGDKFLSRVRIYTLEGIAIGNAMVRLERAKYWKDEYNKLHKMLRKVGLDVAGEQDLRQLYLTRSFYQEVSNILATMADIVRPTTFAELTRYGFDDSPAAAP